MTKEELYEKLGLPSEMYKSDTEKYLDEFFKSNAVIPKGENRHLCADIIHAYAEGINNIEVLRSEGWVEFKQSGMCLCIGDDYRIKPSEPARERQYDTKLNDGSWHYHKDWEWIYKVEHTKRERK